MHRAVRDVFHFSLAVGSKFKSENIQISFFGTSGAITFNRDAIRVFALLFCLAAVLYLPCHAQQNASINGTVTDPAGAVVQGAKVTATNTATNIVRSTLTGRAGVYSLTELPPGPYNVAIQKTGFETLKFPPLSLTVQQVMTLNANLDLGSTHEEVTVHITAPTVDMTDAQLSSVVEHTQMTELPLITLNPYQLVLLSSGVTTSDSYLGGFSVNGARERNDNMLLDGADNNDTDVPGGLGGITSQDPDATEEFRIITNNFAPEFGRNNGAQVDVITKSGTNSLHGDAYYFGRWDALAARDFFNHQPNPITGVGVAPKNPYERNLYGASLGGPIVKDKTFFFVNYQGDRFITTLTDEATVPTPALISGNFTYTNPNTGASAPIDVSTPTSANNAYGLALDPSIQKIFATLYTTPPSYVNSDGITGTLFFPDTGREKDENATIKIDQQINPTNHLSGRYVYNWTNVPRYAGTSALPYDGGIGGESFVGKTQNLVLNWAFNPSPTLVNEALVAATRSSLAFGCAGYGALDSLGLRDQFGVGADYFLFPEGLSYYQGPNCEYVGDLDRDGNWAGTYTFKDTLSKVLNKHSTKFGADIRRVYSNNNTDFYQREQLYFNNYYQSAGAINPVSGVNSNILSPNFPELGDVVSLLLGLVYSQYQEQFFTSNGLRRPKDELDFRQPEYGFFGQDTWKALPSLTFTYGLRWEYFAVPYETSGQLSTLFQNPSGPGPLTFTDVGPGTGHQLYNSYHRDFEPRFGFAWDPFKDGKTSVRGGIGVFSDRVFGNLVNNVRGNPPFEPTVYNLPTQGVASANPNGIPTSQAQLANITPPGTAPFSDQLQNGAFAFPDIFSPNIRPPSVISWNFGIQRQLNNDLTLEVNYVGNHATRILRGLTANPPQPNLVSQLVSYCSNPSNTYGCSNYTLQGGTLYYGGTYGELPFNAVNNNAIERGVLIQTAGRSFYDGLEVTLTERPWHGLQAQLAYTWSHALDDSSDPIGPATNNNAVPIDNFDLQHEYGNSGQDTPQRVVLNFVYHPAIGRGARVLSQGVLGRIFEGWEFAGIATFQSGQPYDIYGALDTLHTDVYDRASVINPSVEKTLPSTGKFYAGGIFTGYNLNAFNPDDGVTAPIPWGIPANVIRNQWFGPGFNGWNVSLAKTVGITERVKFQLRVESYNLFNRPDFYKTPNNYTYDSDFGYSYSQIGQPDGTTGARQFQIAGKITF
ncbi:MAG: TonB-dependent receptor [Candidatus Sulfotelmatobacter sp.]